MIENAGRQALLVLFVAALAVYFAFSKEPALGLDLKGGTVLIYEVDIDKARADGLVDATQSDQQVLTDMLRIIGERIDPSGTREVGITTRGDSGFMIELPDVGETEAEILKRQIETLGRLEMRLVADSDYDHDGVRFKLSEEKDRLTAWLDKEDHRQTLAEFPERIDLFNNLASDEGRIDRENLRWYPHKIFPSFHDSKQWDYSLAAGDPNIVQVFDQAQLAAGPGEWQGDDKPFLVELVPINMHAEHFTGEDMNGAAVRAGTDPERGVPAVFYEIAAGKSSAYADWSGNNVGKKSAIILNKIVRTAPSFRGRIYGTGIIVGSFTQLEVQELAKVIKTGSLQIKPEFVSKQTIGATLGARSIQLGVISILVGGAMVLAFILLYYRLSGLVAFATIALNVFLIYGVVQFIHATVTLPGIAGLVLTMGMAVDANILIYERIREEITRGKELLQAVRTGFDKAMVTILDANVTTFLAGVVLYNVGVGPVRGFAVTLMVGILTSLFTALVVTRLIFHYLITNKKLTQFSAASWFTNLSFDFLKARRTAITGSLIAILGGLAYTTTVKSDEMLGLDFTGGASLELRLSESETERELRSQLLADEGFRAKYPDPIVHRLGEEGTAFSVKLKLSERQRTELEQQREAQKRAGLAFEPPFKAEVLAIPDIPLEPNPFEQVQNVAAAPGSGASNFADAKINFASPVKVADIQSHLARLYGSSVAATAIEGPEVEVSQVVNVEFPILPETTALEITDMISAGLKGMTDASGKAIELSNPIPSAAIIGGRMVGELRTAAIGALVVSLFLIVMYIRVRFREYKYGIGAVVALIHDVLITFAVVVTFNHFGLVNAEIDLPMIAAFLTIIGYSINDTIVIFDRVRENLSDQKRLGDTKESFTELLNRSINQTLSRTLLTSGTTLFVVLAVYLVNRGSGSGLEGFSFALIVGIMTGTYSTVFIASPIVLWLRNREAARGTLDSDSVGKAENSKVAVKGSA